MNELSLFDFLLQALIGIGMYGLLVYTVIYFFLKPVRRAFPNADYKYMFIVPLVLGLAIAFFTRHNAYDALLPDDIPASRILGVIFTGLSIGGFATVIHDYITKNNIDFGSLLAGKVLSPGSAKGEESQEDDK